MKYTEENLNLVCSSMYQEWDSRLSSNIVRDMSPGCFVWDSAKDEFQSFGMFFKRNMLVKYFPSRIATDLEQLIDDSVQLGGFVVALQFDECTVGLRIGRESPLFMEANELSLIKLSGPDK